MPVPEIELSFPFTALEEPLAAPAPPAPIVTVSAFPFTIA
jgi:hypothetical protein